VPKPASRTPLCLRVKSQPTLLFYSPYFSRSNPLLFFHCSTEIVV
jgi:hypothetical protein